MKSCQKLSMRLNEMSTKSSAPNEQNESDTTEENIGRDRITDR